MKRIILYTLFLIFAVSMTANAGTYTLSTYYPSPSGVYDRLKLAAHDFEAEPITCADEVDLGTLFYSFTPGDFDRMDLMVCTFSKTPSGADDYRFMPLDSVWDKTGRDIYLSYLWDPSIGEEFLSADVAKVGIGTTTPLARLHIQGSSSILAVGGGDLSGDPSSDFFDVTNIIDDEPTFLWYPKKSAIRAGLANTTYVLDHSTGGNPYWSEPNIGMYTVAMGYAPLANGLASVAMGYDTAATGDYSVALGERTLARGDGSLAIGTHASGGPLSQTEALGDYSIAIGRNCSAGDEDSGESSIAMGQDSNATADYAVAIGKENAASGSFSFAVNSKNTASGVASFVSGYDSKASGSSSTAMGKENIASGYHSFAVGEHNEAGAYDSAAFGRWNHTSGNPNSWLLNDPGHLFVIGNGTAEGSRSNAVTVLKNGNVGIGLGQDSPTSMLHIRDDDTLDPHPAVLVEGDIHATDVIFPPPDYVFESEYDLESIEDHSKFMWKNKHLKAIPKPIKRTNGKTSISVIGQSYGILEELEKAHIYIEQIHEKNKSLEDKLENQQKDIKELKAMLENLAVK